MHKPLIHRLAQRVESVIVATRPALYTQPLSTLTTKMSCKRKTPPMPNDAKSECIQLILHHACRQRVAHEMHSDTLYKMKADENKCLVCPQNKSGSAAEAVAF